MTIKTSFIVQKNVKCRLLMGVVFLLLSACSAKDSVPTTAVAVEVGVVTLKTESVTLTTELAGRTVLSRASEVRPQVTGLIQSRRFEEGRFVQAGQVLYEIDPAIYQAAVEQVAATLENAKVAVSAARLKDQRYNQLLLIEGISKQDAEDAHVAYEQALAAVAEQKAALATAQINLGYTKIRAPISGWIGISSVTVGALVTASQTTALATIRALDPIFVDVTQSSADLAHLHNSIASGDLQRGSVVVRLKLEDGSTYPKQGKLKFAEVAVDAATGSVTLRAEFPNPSKVLLPGMYLRVELDQAVDSAAILAPQQGISRDAKGNATAMIVDATQHARSRSVSATRVIGDKWLVSSGLVAGEQLVVEGLNKIKDGDLVKANIPTPLSTSAGLKPTATADKRI